MGFVMNIWAKLMYKKWQQNLEDIVQDKNVKKIRRFFWRWRDDINLFVLMIWLFVLGVTSIFLVDRILRLFR